MRFIKASDRLPHNEWAKFCKIGSMMALCFYRKAEDIWTDENGVKYKSKHIAWLDETESPSPQSSDEKQRGWTIQSSTGVEEMADEYAEGMMGIGKYNDKWNYLDKVMYNNLKRACIHGANKRSTQNADITKIINSYDKGMAEYFMQHNYRLMYELWQNIKTEILAVYESSSTPLKTIDLYNQYQQSKGKQ